MQASLLSILRCPHCAGQLTLEGTTEAWIETGTLVCTKNNRRYPIIRGMPHVYIDDEQWRPKAREAVGWVKYHQDHNMYDQAGSQIDFQLPYFPEEPWIEVARQFDIALELVDPKPGARVLDLGAGRGWAAKQFALRGCQVVAVDIVDDEHVGLGRSRAMMEQAGVVFDTMIADSERLPFAPNSFDIVFCAAALHHTTDLHKLLQNVGRVLRAGGTMVAINEPCVADSSDDAELRRTVLAEELAYGINETRPRLDDYRRVVRQAGLHEQALFTWPVYRKSMQDMASWAYELGISPPQDFVEQPQHGRDSSWQKWLGRPKSKPVYFGELPQLWIDHLLRERGGSMTLLARK